MPAAAVETTRMAIHVRCANQERRTIKNLRFDRQKYEMTGNSSRSIAGFDGMEPDAVLGCPSSRSLSGKPRRVSVRTCRGSAQPAFFTGGGDQVPVRIEGDFSLGRR